MSSHVEKIKERLSITDVLSSYLKIEKAGGNFKAKCPFHNEKTPSFFISPSRNSYYCFGCGAKGDIFTFVQEFEGLDFMGALKVLALRAGVELIPENPQAKTERERLYSVMEHAALFFQKNLGASQPALLYLKRRGLKIETVRDWRIGFAPLEWRLLHDYLLGKGFAEGEMEKAGLIKRADSEYGGAERARHYDRFRGRVMFPIFDSSGRVIAFSGRILVDDDKAPKYLNSPDTPLFNKSEALYGFHAAKLEMKRRGFAIVVEGQMDLLMAQQAGWQNSVAVSGTALTAFHLGMAKRLTDKVLFAFDADNAGFAAAEKSAKAALGMGMEVRMITIQGGKDPADLILSDPSLWQKAVEEATHVIDFVLEKVMSRKLDERAMGKEIAAKVLPYVAVLESAIEKAQVMARIAERTRIREEALWEELRKAPSILPEEGSARAIVAASVPATAAVQQPKARQSPIEQRLLGVLFWQKEAPAPKVSIANLEAELRRILTGAKLDEAIAAVSEDEKSALIFQAEMLYDAGNSVESELKELLNTLEHDGLKQAFVAEMEQLSQAEKAKDTEAISRILKRCHELSEKIRSVKR